MPYVLERDLTLHQEAVLAALRALADDTGIVQLPAHEIAEVARVSPDTVHRMTRKLALRGVIVRRGGRGKRPVEIEFTDDANRVLGAKS